MQGRRGRTDRPLSVRPTGGYTLIEVIVALGILAVVTAIAMPHFDSRRLQITSAQRQVMAQLRWARSAAMTRGMHYAVEFPTATQIRVERMQLVGGVWQVDPAATQTVPLPPVTQIAPTSIGTTVEFNTRGMAVNLTQPQQITLSDTFGNSRAVQAWPSGQVNEL